MNPCLGSSGGIGVTVKLLSITYSIILGYTHSLYQNNFPGILDWKVGQKKWIKIDNTIIEITRTKEGVLINILNGTLEVINRKDDKMEFKISIEDLTK